MKTNLEERYETTSIVMQKIKEELELIPEDHPVYRGVRREVDSLECNLITLNMAMRSERLIKNLSIIHA